MKLIDIYGNMRNAKKGQIINFEFTAGIGTRGEGERESIEGREGREGGERKEERDKLYYTILYVHLRVLHPYKTEFYYQIHIVIVILSLLESES